MYKTGVGLSSLIFLDEVWKPVGGGSVYKGEIEKLSQNKKKMVPSHLLIDVIPM